MCVTLIKVLDALATGSGRSMRALDLSDFFQSGLAIYRMEHFHLVINRFKELSTLNINFNCMSEVVVRNLAATCAGNLRHLSILVCNGGQLAAIRSPMLNTHDIVIYILLFMIFQKTPHTYNYKLTHTVCQHQMFI